MRNMEGEHATYPCIAYSVIDERLVCLVADVGRFTDFDATIRCVLEDLSRGDWEDVMRGSGRRWCWREEEREGTGGRGVIIGGDQTVVNACDIEERLEG